MVGTLWGSIIHAGAIMWELGGKQSTFKLKAAPGQVLDSAGEIFAYQHDPEATGNDEYMVFDDESGGGGGLLPYSPVVTVKLDLAAKVATLVKSVEQPEGLVAGAEGNAQTTRNGDLPVGWGPCPASRSSARPGSCCSTPSSRPASPPTAPTACRGIRPVGQARPRTPARNGTEARHGEEI